MDQCSSLAKEGLKPTILTVKSTFLSIDQQDQTHSSSYKLCGMNDLLYRVGW